MEPQYQQPVAYPMYAQPGRQKPTSEEIERKYLFRAPVGDQGERVDQVRQIVCAAAKSLVKITPVSPEQTRMLNALDEVAALATYAMTRNE